MARRFEVNDFVKVGDDIVKVKELLDWKGGPPKYQCEVIRGPNYTGDDDILVVAEPVMFWPTLGDVRDDDVFVPEGVEFLKYYKLMNRPDDPAKICRIDVDMKDLANWETYPIDTKVKFFVVTMDIPPEREKKPQTPLLEDPVDAAFFPMPSVTLSTEADLRRWCLEQALEWQKTYSVTVDVVARANSYYKWIMEGETD